MSEKRNEENAFDVDEYAGNFGCDSLVASMHQTSNSERLGCVQCQDLCQNVNVVATDMDVEDDVDALAKNADLGCSATANNSSIIHSNPT
ncbi:unnamed protein product [Taenia asiatica]|uniref:FxLD family lantipeptide n=1 Tax=Taenia asiatica TaxID=60517 RepID=A0A0R3W081_TAEAS|nr:unnamed protein product [Taenia asiatica]